MSKSLGNVVDPLELVKDYGAEAVRYFLLRHISPFEDGDLTKESFKDAYNANLVNGLGNLVSRVMKMASQYLDGPVSIPNEENKIALAEYMDRFEVNSAISAIWSKMSEVDDMIQKERPFELIKSDKEKAKSAVANYVLKLSEISRLLRPFLPKTAVQIQQLIEANKMPEAPLFPRK
jgi:methionyl-tRNA synthetase